MVEATHRDKELVVEILAQSFHDNLSVNYLIPQDSKRVQRIKELMAYSFDLCRLWGKVWLTEDKRACALVIFPDLKRTTLPSLLLMGRLILKSIGFLNIAKAHQSGKSGRGASSGHSILPCMVSWCFAPISRQGNRQ